MQTHLASLVKAFFSRSESGRRKEPAPTAAQRADVGLLSISLWAGRRAQHQVRVIDRQEESAQVWSPEYVDVGETVWLDVAGKASQCRVKDYVAAGGGYRLGLAVVGASKRAKKRIPTNAAGDLEWVDGLTRVRCPVRVTNVTADGAQVTMSRPAPEIRSVRLQFDGRVKVGTVRYCVQVGGAYLAGIEYV